METQSHYDSLLLAPYLQTCGPVRRYRAGCVELVALLASHRPSAAVFGRYEESSLNRDEVPVGLTHGSPERQPNSELTIP